MELTQYFIITIISAIYVIGFVATLDVDTTIYDWNSNHTTYYNRKATSKDVWKAIIWPIRLTIFIAKFILQIIHNAFSILLLLFFIPYRYNNVYTKIDKFLD